MTVLHTAFGIEDKRQQWGTLIPHSAFAFCSGLTDIAIPYGVTSIGDEAFSYCGLTDITIPDSVTSIGTSAFRNCDSLASATIPESVTSISASAFRECRSLTSVTLPDSLMSIGRFAFYKCGLTSITLPGGLTSIGNDAFYGCYDLTDVYFNGTQAQWDAITIEESNGSLTGAVLHCLVDSALLTLPASLTTIGSEAFAGVAAESVFIPYTVTSIAEDAFEGSAIHIIHGFPGTAVETFANEHGFTFVGIDFT